MHLSNRIYLVLQIHLFYTLALKSTLPPLQPSHLLTQFLPQNFTLPTNNTNAFPLTPSPTPPSAAESPSTTTALSSPYSPHIKPSLRPPSTA
ncbi:hypothetical protein ABVK25_006552 [Lepraria finkii]|uniref:Uncharacterized protein n=1 Tax=Lepraria finkii TaxID=1340010 RepID=A0ABR4B5U5_9LECA